MPYGNDLARVVVDHRPDRLLAVGVGDPLHEERAVEVPDVALGPPPRGVRKDVERRRVVFEDVSSHPHVPHRRAQPSSARVGALLEHREPLEEPMRLHLVGRFGLSDDAIDERRDPGDVVGVEDVRKFVGDEFLVPIVDVAEGRHVVGRGDVQVDRVVRDRGRRAVGRVGLVREKDLGDLARRPAHRGHEPRVDPLGQGRDVLRDFFFGRVVGDPKMRGLDRLPQQLRIVGRVRRARSARRHGRPASTTMASRRSKPPQSRRCRSPLRGGWWALPASGRTLATAQRSS